MIDRAGIDQRWQADGSKRDERGRRVFGASEARAAAEVELWRCRRSRGSPARRSGVGSKTSPRRFRMVDECGARAAARDR
jgi:hypothetical protein